MSKNKTFSKILLGLVALTSLHLTCLAQPQQGAPTPNSSVTAAGAPVPGGFPAMAAIPGSMPQAPSVKPEAASDVPKTSSDAPAKVMTVDELIKQGQITKLAEKEAMKNAATNIRLPALPVEPPRVMAPQKTVKEPLPLVKEPHILLGVFLSNGMARATIETLVTRKSYVLGDWLTEGWQIVGIGTHEVDLQKCIKAKCTNKILSLAQ